MPGSSWRSWNGPDAVLLPLAGALMRAAWIAPPVDAVLRRLASDETAGGVGAMVFALLLGASFTAKLAQPSRYGRWIVAMGGLLAVLTSEWWAIYRRMYPAWDVRWLIGLPAQLTSWPDVLLPLTALAAAALLWWRGLSVDWTSHSELARSFVGGVVAFAIGLEWLSSWSPQTARELPGAIALFLASAWAGLSLAEVSEASRSAGRRTGAIRLNRYWVVAVIAVVAGIFGAGLIVAGLVTPRTVATALAGLRPIWDAVTWAAIGLFIGLAYVVFLLLTPVIWLLQLLAGNNTSQPIQPPSPLTDLTPNGLRNPAILPPAVEWTLRGVFISGLVILVGLLFAWALRRHYSRDDEGVKESRELIWSWDLIRAQLALALAGRRQARPRPLFGSLAGKADDPRVAVRASYRRLLSLAVEQGQPRQPGQTPKGYLPTLLLLWPDEAEELQMLTEAYTTARYGPLLPSLELVEQIRRGVERIITTSDGQT